MTIESKDEEKRNDEVFEFFTTTVLDGLISFKIQAQAKFNILPTEFFLCFLSLLSAYQKYSTQIDKDIMKDLINTPDRDVLVEYFLLLTQQRLGEIKAE